MVVCLVGVALLIHNASLEAKKTSGGPCSGLEYHVCSSTEFLKLTAGQCF